MNSVAEISDPQGEVSKNTAVAPQNTSYRVKSRSEIESLLKKLHKNHTLLSIRMESRKQTFGSMLLEINPEKKYLVLDELYPRKEIKESLMGKKLIIDTHLDGIEVGFSVNVEAVAERENIEYYKVSYPRSLFHHQRRASFRVDVGVSTSIPIALSTLENVMLQAELRDISLGGLSARISTPMSSGLSTGDEIPTCIIHTPAGKKIVCALEIARLEENEQSQSLRIGARFIHLPASDRNELSRFIAGLERENIKKLKRTGDNI